MRVESRGTRDIRSRSRFAVLQSLLSAGESTRSEITRQTGLSPATVATIVTELQAEQIITDAGQETSGIGRPTMRLKIDESRGYIVGVDVAETYVHATMFDLALREVATEELPLDELSFSLDYVTNVVSLAMTNVLDTASVSRAQVIGVGVSLPGWVQPQRGVSVLSPKGMPHEVPIREVLSRSLELPVVIDNPLKAIATAELWFGSGKACTSLVTVNLGTGVGAGVILNGTVLRGADNNAGEWGHTLLQFDGRNCRCGRRGCIEAYVGVAGIRTTLQEINPDHRALEYVGQSQFMAQLCALLEQDPQDPDLAELIARTSRYLAAGLEDLILVLNPQVITLTGWTTWNLGKWLHQPTLAALLAESEFVRQSEPVVEFSTVLGNPVVRGMAALSFERFLGDIGLPSITAVVGG